ncbi:MAG: hypothetical protein DMD65_11490 [Gemmatimonadetes bacterium]|nr:MAG: hypothetical protein DMD65_11490 [Gemmatimonadota bacterium]
MDQPALATLARAPESVAMTYQLRPLSVGEILDGSLALLRRHFALILGIAVVCEGLPTAMDVYMDLAGGTLRHPGLNLLDRVLTAIGSMLVTGATVRIVSEAYLGRTPRLGDALRFAGGRLAAIFGANLLGGLLTFLALIALVIPGVVVACGYSVAAEVAALESGSAGDALRRSWDLTKGFKLKALVLWVVSVSLILLVFLGAGALGGFVAALAGGLDALVTLLAAFVSLLIYPLISCVFTLFYYDLRVRKEGFDLEVLSRQLGLRA